MRKVEVFRKVVKYNDEGKPDGHEEQLLFIGHFHRFVMVGDWTEGGSGEIWPNALVEDEDGKVCPYSIECIRFIDPPEKK
jgi:hypothetical protein